MRPHEWFIEHRVEYATLVLDAEDLQAFDGHLPGCEECRREIARIEADLEWLPMGLAPAAVGPEVRRRILEGVLRRRAVPQRRWWPVPVGLAASALLFAGGWLLGGSRSRDLRRELARQEAAMAALQDTLSITRQANRILQANVEVGDTKGGMLIFADEVTHRWNVVIHGLPPASAGHRYQFWFICSDGMVRGNAVAADQARPTIFTTGMPEARSCPAVKGAALTEEPMADEQGPPRGKSLAHVML